MITVHHLNNSKSQRILWALEELELDYNIEFYARQSSMMAPDDLKHIHPLGKAPVADIDGYVMAESGAVVEYLVHKYGAGKLAPAVDSPLYAKYIEFMHYPEGSLSPPMLSGLFSRLLEINHEGFSGLIAMQIQNHLTYVNGLLEGNEYLVGDEFSAADLQITFNLQGAASSGALASYPNIQAFVARMEARPAYLRAIEKGGPFDLSFGRS